MHIFIHYTQKKNGATKSLAGFVAPWRARLTTARARARVGGGIFRPAKLTTSTLVFVFNLNLRPKTCNNQEVGERSRTTTCMHPIGGLLHASPACTCKIAQLANQYSNNNQLETDWIKSTGNTCIWFN